MPLLSEPGKLYPEALLLAPSIYSSFLPFQIDKCPGVSVEVRIVSGGTLLLVLHLSLSIPYRCSSFLAAVTEGNVLAEGRVAIY